MLKEIRCVHFSHSKISFHPGLNVILGDDDAKNSIGKSTVLMVIDFVLGGTTFLKDDAGAIRELGHHHYDYAFEFGKKQLFFSRATEASDVVYVCDENYARLNELPLEKYLALLKHQYGLDDFEGSFRSTLSPFARIWRKGGLEPDQPFVSMPKESSAVAIGRLVDMFDRSADIAEEKNTLDVQKERRTLIKKSMDSRIIPKITKKQYDENIGKIAENYAQIDQLKQGLGGHLVSMSRCSTRVCSRSSSERTS
ncbi:AAA family ATPase [Nitrogeniibacter mangrovi]|uniref:AAA family ATPase n=1 Tax=Nitrogeniibacter mangrovi TaxID=2016596 RepID=UPI001C2D9141|nr:AAA family ATPase [Nitrogeniibacter mangrovi]